MKNLKTYHHNRKKDIKEEILKEVKMKMNKKIEELKKE
jgi:hypothetical protein